MYVFGQQKPEALKETSSQINSEACSIKDKEGKPIKLRK